MSPRAGLTVAVLGAGGRIAPALVPPIGPQETIHTLHSELRSSGDSFGCREASFRFSLPEALVARLVDLSKAPPAERERADREALPPSPRTVSTHVVEALGDGRRVRVRAVAS
jgi:hypothetical protein